MGTCGQRRSGPHDRRACQRRLSLGLLPVAAAMTIVLTASPSSAGSAGVVLREARRVLRPDGRLVLTVPTPRGKPVLEVLARLGAVSREEIRDHKIYYDRARLTSTLARHGLVVERYDAFQLGWNSLCVARPA